MFLHSENQQLLWQTLQKSPYLVEFNQKFAGYRDKWFRGSIEQFFTQWISQNGRVPTNAKELLEINKFALQFMVADLKRLLGYSSPQPMNSSSSDLSSYNVAEERKRREDTWSANFNQYQSEYNRMLEKPVLPVRELPSETGDEKIKNMEELLREHAKLRDMDLSIYTPSPQKPTGTNVQKLKIMEDIERVDILEPVKKSVHWSNAEATIREATIREATIREATIREATIREATIREATISEATISEATGSDIVQPEISDVYSRTNPNTDEISSNYT